MEDEKVVGSSRGGTDNVMAAFFFYYIIMNNQYVHVCGSPSPIPLTHSHEKKKQQHTLFVGEVHFLSEQALQIRSDRLPQRITACATSSLCYDGRDGVGHARLAPSIAAIIVAILAMAVVVV